MAFIIGEDRNQISLLPNTLDDFVDEDNPVRVIDAYVDSVDLQKLGFVTYSGNSPGQRPYKRSDLLKLYIYCYMNGIRSSRKMESEATRNVEVMWLVGKIRPDHGTLSAFMKDNKAAIRRLFKEFTLFLKGFGLINGELVAIDGTKIKANSAKRRHYNENIIKKKLEYYDSKIEEYISDFLSETDNDTKQLITEKVSDYRERIQGLKAIKKELEETGEKQVCITDPDARSMKNNGKFEVCFNVQVAVDGKHKLFIGYDVINEVNDQGQLSNMVNKARQTFPDQPITVLADTGYYNLEQILDVVDERTEILIKPQKGKQAKVKSGFDKSNFSYNQSSDTYICPAGYVLSHKWNGKSRGKNYMRYVCEDYAICGHKDECTSAKGGRAISRVANEEVIESVVKNTEDKKDTYQKRGWIVEHPFGTIKRHFGYTYFLTRGLESVRTEASLIGLAYNLKRLIKIKGVREFVAYFRAAITLDSFLKYIFMNKTVKPALMSLFPANC